MSETSMLKFSITVTCVILLIAACTPIQSDRGQAESKKPALIAAARGVVENRAGQITVNAAREGRIIELAVEEGNTVTAGQVLAVLDDRQSQLIAAIDQAELSERKAKVATADAKLLGARRDLERVHRLVQLEASTAQEVDQASTAERVAGAEAEEAVRAVRVATDRALLSQSEVDLRTVRAPVTGLILHRTAVVGATVPMASPLFVLVPKSDLIVRAEVDESMSEKVRPGMIATVTREFDVGQPVAARVLRVGGSFSGAALNDDPMARRDGRVIEVILVLKRSTAFKLGQRVLVRFTK
jgi:multidrug resistance efflux pump